MRQVNADLKTTTMRNSQHRWHGDSAGGAGELDLPCPGPGLAHEEDCRARCREVSGEHPLVPDAGAGVATPMPGGDPGTGAFSDERPWVSAYVGSLHEGVRDVRNLPAVHE